MDWELSSHRPVFYQICERLRAEILRGGYPPGTQFPTTRQLASDIAVNPNTVQRALALLEEEGLLYTNGTLGRFVTEDVEVLERARAQLQRSIVQGFLKKAHALGISAADIVRIIKEEENVL